MTPRPLTPRPVTAGPVVLAGRRVRDRAPSAVHWRLIEYDPATRLPVADLGSQWEPAAMAAVVGLSRVSEWVTAWVAEVVGPAATIGDPAGSLAGPGSWYVTSPALTDSDGSKTSRDGDQDGGGR